jgi:hypothetical protein
LGNAAQIGSLHRPNSKARGNRAGRKRFYPYGKTYAQTIAEQD